MQDETEWSLVLYKLLSNKFGTAKEVRRRQINHIVKDKLIGYVEGVGYSSRISSGSRAEGLDFSDSDMDVMFCLSNKYANVFQTEKDADLHGDMPIRLIIESESKESVFIKLRSHRHDELDKCLPFMFDGIFLSNTYFKEYFLKRMRQMKKMKIHGPCVSTLTDSHDIAFTLGSSKWINQANSWISRPRSAWPSTNMIKTISGYGVHFVPIGCKESKYEDLQWRISFSVAEKLLICSFTHTQLLCYAAMKVMLKDLIQQKQPDLLCSYFVKTIMLWLAEEIDPTIWTPVNMIWCFKMCMERLIYCVEYKLCSHYFIPEVNLCENRFPGQRHSQLLVVLENLNKLGWESLFHTRLCPLYSVKTLCTSELPYFLIQVRSLLYIFRSFEYLRKDRSNMLIFCYYIFHHLQIVVNRSLNTLKKLNKYFYNQYTNAVSYLLLATLINAPSAWSNVALIFRSCKNYSKSKIVVRHCYEILSCVNFLKKDIRSFEITKPLFGYISQFIEPIMFKDETIDFCCASDLLPNEIKPSMNPFERSQIIDSEESYCNYAKNPLTTLVECILQEIPFAKVLNLDLFERSLTNVSFKIQSMILHKREATVRVHAWAFLHFIEMVSLYHLKDLNGARRALRNLETEIYSSFTDSLRKGLPTDWDLLSVSVAKRLLRNLERQTS